MAFQETHVNHHTTSLQGGSQDVKTAPFSTEGFSRVLGADMKQFLDFLAAVNARKGELGKWSSCERYRLGQFTTNRSRIGILGSSTIPGIRKVATDYAANAYQTMVNEDTLRVLCEEADRVLVSQSSSEETPPKGKGSRRRSAPSTGNASSATNPTRDAGEKP